MLFGRVDPRHIPESGSWWKGRQTELVSASDDHEHRQITSMVTVTHNDPAPELIAHARRGPCAVPTAEEKFAYLLTRRGPSDKRPNIQEEAAAAFLLLSVAHVLCEAKLLGLTQAHAPRTGTVPKLKRDRLCTATS